MTKEKHATSSCCFCHFVKVSCSVQTIIIHVLNTGHQGLPLKGTLSPSVTLQEVYADSKMSPKPPVELSSEMDEN